MKRSDITASDEREIGVIMRTLKARGTDDLRKKLILEVKFRPIILKQFRAETEMFKASVEETGTPPTLSAEEWTAMFLAQYPLAFDRFTDRSGLSGFENQALDSGLDGFADRRAPITATQVIGTTSAAMALSLTRAETALREAGETITRPVLARVGANLLRPAMMARTSSIATTETQVPAEEAKGQTAAIKQKPDKVWNTVGDERVRRHHADADFQTRTTDQPFTVKSELLKWPGDTSLGATAGNVIRCRCFAEYK